MCACIFLRDFCKLVYDVDALSLFGDFICVTIVGFPVEAKSVKCN